MPRRWRFPAVSWRLSSRARQLVRPAVMSKTSWRELRQPCMLAHTRMHSCSPTRDSCPYIQPRVVRYGGEREAGRRQWLTSIDAGANGMAARPIEVELGRV